MRCPCPGSCVRCEALRLCPPFSYVQTSISGSYGSGNHANGVVENYSSIYRPAPLRPVPRGKNITRNLYRSIFRFIHFSVPPWFLPFQRKSCTGSMTDETKVASLTNATIWTTLSCLPNTRRQVGQNIYAPVYSRVSCSCLNDILSATVRLWPM